jgi:hypothetical protein
MTSSRPHRILESVIAVEAIALIVYLLVPVVKRMEIGARAQAIARDVQVVERAATFAQGERGEWPADGEPGERPTALEAYLPESFRFDRGAYRIDWERWPLSDGLASDARTGDLIGVSVETEDPRIAAAIVARLGGSRPHFTVGDRTTFVIANTLKAE